MRFVSSDEIRTILTYPKCIELMRTAMESVSNGDAKMPLRQAMALPDSRNLMGMMPGYLGGETNAFGMKLLSLYPDNAKAGFPSHMGLYALFDAKFGQPIAIMDANALTAIRTACATAAASDILAREDAQVMLIIGTGEQAESHFHALSEIRQFQEIKLWGRDHEKAVALAERLQPEISALLKVEDIISEAAKGADIITTVTASPTPILSAADVAPGTHVNAVGASHRGVMEIAPELLTKGHFVVDHLPSAMDQAGEMLKALDAGLIADTAQIAEIGDVFLGKTSGRTASADITIYKSLGIAAQDIVAAQYILEEATRLDLGQVVSL